MPPTNFHTRKRVQDSNAAQTRKRMVHQGEALNLYWGNLHAHTDMSGCIRYANPPRVDLLSLERDLNKLDFCSITDHGFNLDFPIWQYTRELVGQYNDPGLFLTPLGEEWSSGIYGHHNVIYENPHFPRFYDSHDGRISPSDVARDIGDEEDFVIIPHQLADNNPTDWTVKDEVHTPLAEIYQHRGSYEYLGAPRQAYNSHSFAGNYLQDAWARGTIIGVIASSDHGGGTGYAGVWAKDLSRESLFEAFHARHTYGTTGEKMMLFFASGDAMMGDKVERKENTPIGFTVKADTLPRIRTVDNPVPPC